MIAVEQLPSYPDGTPQDPERLGWLVAYGIRSLLTVPLSGRGVRLGQVASSGARGSPRRSTRRT
ncbi:hypothetical protein SANTM175S_02247 [Streptomyces antimycoticus]